MTSPDSRSPMARGLDLVARVMAAAMMMVLPGILGQWLDDKLGTSFLVLFGFALGIGVSIYYLILITRPTKNSGDQKPSKGIDCGDDSK